MVAGYATSVELKRAGVEKRSLHLACLSLRARTSNLVSAAVQVPDVYMLPRDNAEGVVPFMAGQQLAFTVRIQPYDRFKLAAYRVL